jgi:hypothetical protein
MNKATAVFTTPTATKTRQLPTGRLLINDADEIIYANTQARHFLGLFSEDPLPAGQQFLPLLRQSYQFHSTADWRGWPKRASDTTARYLIYTSPNSFVCSLLKVEIVENILLDGNNIWVISIDLVESTAKATVAHPFV